jgi:hypothetical protein
MTANQTPALRAAHNAALDDLDYHWGEVYDLAVTPGGWIARRLDNNRSFMAETPDELRALIRADYAAEPVCHDLRLAPARHVTMPGLLPARPPSAHLQAAALRAAFPAYAVSVIARRGARPRFEAISRDGSSPCCLISADASEIWRELHAATRPVNRQAPPAGASGSGSGRTPSQGRPAVTGRGRRSPVPPPSSLDEPSRPGHNGQGRSAVGCSTLTGAVRPAPLADETTAPGQPPDPGTRSRV